MSGKTKKITIITSIIAIIVLIMVGIYTNSVKNVDNTALQLTAEQRRSAEYNVIKDEEGKIEATDGNVEFRVYFTRKKNDDSDLAEKVDGTCKQINSKDTLFMELNVLDSGTLKNGKITINGSNFNYSMFMVKDYVLQESYISNDVKEIKLNDIKPGTQKLIFGNVIADIGNNTKNYSNTSTITLTGTYVPDDKNNDENTKEVEINKEYKVTVDWYGELNAKLNTYKSTYYYDNIKSNKIDFNFQVSETKKELLLKDVIATAEIPKLNDFAPENVECSDPNVDVKYEKETRNLTLTRSSTVDNDIITKSLSRQNNFKVTVTYPEEAFNSITEYTELLIPITGQYIGYNNTNEQFKGKDISNIVNGTIPIIFKPTPSSIQEDRLYKNKFEVQIQNKKWVTKPTERYVMSKQDILNLYDNSEYKGNYEYTVRWSAYSGNANVLNYYEMTETKNGNSDETYGDKFDDKVINDYIINKGIYFSNATKALGEDGYISVYNEETGELIHTFTKDDWNTYTSTNLYDYSKVSKTDESETDEIKTAEVKHIKIVTSKPIEDTYLYVYNVKEFDKEKLTGAYTKEEMEAVSKLHTYLTGVANIKADEGTKQNLDNVSDEVYLVSETSDAKISIEPKKIHTQETTNCDIYIETVKSQLGDADWKNGEFIVELPKDIIKLDVKNVTADKSEVQVVAYESYKKDENYIIKIITKNEEKTTYKLTIDCDITPDSRIGTSNKDLTLYAYNEHSNIYYESIEDKYDANSNNNIEEKVGKAICQLELVSPTSLITLETVSDYNGTEEFTIAPNVAEVEKKNKQATIELSLRNNYPYTVTGVKILGKIPFKGNKYIINKDKDMNSEFDTTMLEGGIKTSVEKVQEKMIVYYSENENPTQDIENPENEWKQKEENINWDNVKTYLIFLQDYEIKYKDEIKFNYNIKLPDEVEYNKVSYSNHAVYFDFITDGGRIDLYTEPAKVGVKIVDKFDLELNKYKINSQLKIPGVTYSLSYKEKDTEGKDQTKTRIITTDSEGKVEVKDLHVGVEYTLKEIKVPDTCELSTDVIKFTVNENRQVEITDKKIRSNFLQNDVLQIDLEDEIKANLKINKTKKGQDNVKINDVRFALEDADGNKKTGSTKDGTLTFEGVSLNKKYTLTEVAVPGKVELNTNKFEFELKRENGSIKVESKEGESLIEGEASIEDRADVLTPTINVNIKDEIRYSLVLTKNDEAGQPAQGIQFSLKGKGQKDQGSIYTTTKSGKITVSGLYVNQEYELEEVKALGYYLDGKIENKLKFKVTRNGKLKIENQITEQGLKLDGEAKLTEDGLDAVLSFTVKNEKIPTYNLKIAKKDDDDKLLPGAQFKLKSIDTGIEQNLTTGEDGTCTFNGLYEYVKEKEFVTGKYELTETYAPEGYRLNTHVVTFHVEKDAETDKLNFVIDNEDEENEGDDKNTFDFLSVENDATTSTEERTITINYINKPIFTLKKQDENGNALAGAKFEIKKEDGSNAVTVYGEEIGELETNSEGEITANLPEGLYQIIETESPEGYQLPENEEEKIHYFGVGKSRPAEKSDQVDTIEWQDSIGSDYITEFKSAVKTLDGGIIAVGSTDTDTLVGENTEKGYGNQDGIIVKYSSKGEIEWSKFVGGEGYDELFEIESDPNGEMYAVVGYVDSSSVKYNGDNLTETDYLADYGQADGFVMMIDDQGNKQWAKTIGKKENDRINSVAINENGEVAVTGSYHENGSKKGYICTFDNSGACDWHKDLNSTADVWGEAITATSDGFAVGVNFNGNELNIESETSKVSNTKTDGTTDSVVIGFTSEGDYQWNTPIGSAQNDEIFDMVKYVDANGNDMIAVVGAFGASISNHSLSTKGVYDGMLVKLQEENGNWSSSISIGGSSDDVINSIEPTNNGGLVLGGWTYSSSVKCGSTNIVTSNKGENDGFIIEIDDSNNVVWSDAIQGSSFDSVDGVVQTKDDSFYAVGDFDSKTVTALNNTEIPLNTSSSFPDAYVIKYAQTVIAQEIPDVKEIEVKNKLKEFKITTEIGENLHRERNGGTITGTDTSEANKKFVESVKYGQDSKENIVIDPDDNHSITKITINEEEVVFTPDKDGTVTIPEGYFQNMTEDKHIVVIFSDNKYTLTIKKEDNNKEPLEGADFEIKSKSGDETKTYKATTDKNGEAKVEVDEYGEYTVKETKAPEHYILSDDEKEVNISENGDTDKTVTFTNQKYALVIVHHYLKENNSDSLRKVADDVIYEGKPGDHYDTFPRMDLEGLTLEKKNKEDILPDDEDDIYVIPKNATGEYSEHEDIVVNYYYEPTPMELTIHHYIQGTEDEVILDGKPVEEEVEFTDSKVTFDEDGNYTVSASAKYKLEGNENYKKLTSDYIFTNVTTQSLDEEGLLGDLNTPEITDEFEYNTDSEIIYYYELKSHTITSEVIQHEEDRTNEEFNVKEKVQVDGGTITGKYTDEYPEEDRKMFIEEVPQKEDSKEQINIKPDYGYKVKYVKVISTPDEGEPTESVVYGKEDEKTDDEENEGQIEGGEEKKDQIEGGEESAGPIDGEEENEGKVEVKEKDERVNVAVTKFQSVTEDKHIVTEFEPLEGNVNVHHVIREDGKEDKEVKNGTIHGLVGEPYQTGPIDIEHYEMVDSKGDTTGEYTEADKDVYYYYELKEYKYTVEYYYDKVMDPEKTMEGKAKFDSTITDFVDKNITGYKLVDKTPKNEENPDKVNLKITDDPKENVIRIYYEKDKFPYTIEYFYDGVKAEDETVSGTATYQDVITEYEETKRQGYKLVKKTPVNKDGEVELTITEDPEKNVIRLYYRSEYKITTSVRTHREEYVNGDVKEDVAGGTISSNEDPNEPYEKVLKGDSNEKDIVIQPDSGYTIVNIWISDGPEAEEAEFNYEKLINEGTVTIPKGYFDNMNSDKHIEVEFRKISKVIVKYLEKDGTEFTENELASQITIDGYEGKPYTTSRADVTYYRNATDKEGQITPSNASGTMKADDITVIYYYERIPAGITVKYREKILDENDNEIGIAIPGYEDKTINGYVGLQYETTRENIPNYVPATPVDAPSDPNSVINVSKSENTKDGIYGTQPVEIVYWYEREFNISTKVIPHKENRTNKETGIKEEILEDGGTITGQDAEVLEKVIYNHTSKQRIEIKPKQYYNVKSIAIVGIDRDGTETKTYIYGENAVSNAEIIYQKNEDGTIILSYFVHVKEDKRVEVEFEPVYGEVIVHHYIAGTGEQFGKEPIKVPSNIEGEVVENETIRDLIGEPYTTSPSENVSNIYKLVDRYGEESGEITTDTINVYYYYNFKEFEYKVEYYYDGEKDDTETETFTATYGDKITRYDDKVRTGYRFEKVEPTNEKGEVELSITDKIENNVIKVYYVKDNFNYTVEYYYDGIIDPNKTETHEAIYEQEISTYDEKLEPGYEKEKVENIPLIVSEDVSKNVIKVYYRHLYNITTKVKEHTEKYSDGTEKENIKGGKISGDALDSYEKVFKDQNSTMEIVIEPDEDYEIVKITISDANEETDDAEILDYSELIQDGKVTIPAGYFTNMQSDKHVEVEFRKKSKVIVKYLEEETKNVLYKTEDNMEYIEILGYEGKEFETEKKVIPYYKDSDLGITDENGKTIEPNGTMFADEFTVIYWYRKIESGVMERHIEINEKGETKELESKLIEGYVSENAVTNRKTYENYISVNGPKNEAPNITVAGKDETSKTVIFEENNVLEVWYYYERVFKITTEVKSHKEIIDNQEVTIDGGTISKEFIENSNGEKTEVPYEEVLCRGNNAKEIIMKPDEKYKVKSISINDIEISIESLEQQENGEVKIPIGYIADVKEDKHVVVEFERIPAKVIVQYKDIDTNESIKEDKVLEGYIDTEYHESRFEIADYIPAGEEPTNNEGKMTKETIIVTYWYKKQFKITTDVKEHIEENNESVKGGEISGEDETPYEIVSRGETSQKEITVKPEYGYRIKALIINKQEIGLEGLLKEDGTITLPKFENMQEDKHIVVEFERKPGKVIVKYIDIDTQEEISEQKIIEGYVKDPYSVERIELAGYIASGDEPKNKFGEMTDGEIVVLFFYQKQPEIIPEAPIQPENSTPQETIPEQIIPEQLADEDTSLNLEVEQNESDIKDVKTGDNIIAYIITLVSSIIVFIKSFKHKK